MKSYLLFLFQFLLIVVIIFGAITCSKDTPTETPADTFESVIAAGDVYPTYTESIDSIVTEDVSDPRPDGTFWNCTFTKYDVTNVPYEAQTFDPSTDIIYPGSLLQGKSLENDPPDPIVVKRAGGTVYISIVNGSQNHILDVKFELYDSAGTKANEVTVTNIGALAQVQYNGILNTMFGLASGVDYSLRVSIAKSTIINPQLTFSQALFTYGSKVDNRTGDPNYIEATYFMDVISTEALVNCIWP